MTSTISEPPAQTVQPIDYPIQADAATISYEDFLVQYDGIHAEWVDGKVEVMSPVGYEHQDLAGWLLVILRGFVRHRAAGVVVFAPFTMRLVNKPRGREPDIMFVRAERTDLIKPGYLDGPADIAVEIISPESEARDRGDKFVEYQTASIGEYWLIDPLRQEVTFYRLGEDQLYRAVVLDAEGRFHSVQLAGFWLNPAWFWQRPRVAEFDVLKELGVL